MTILGIDPGSSRTGYGCITDHPLRFQTAGVIDFKEKDPNKKILILADRYQKLLDTLQPDIVAIEKIFFSRNVKTAIEVAQARGALILLTLKNKIALVEFGPTQVKQAVTNYGLADKKAVAKMVAAILKIDLSRAIDDTTDALAIAITAAHTNQY